MRLLGITLGMLLFGLTASAQTGRFEFRTGSASTGVGVPTAALQVERVALDGSPFLGPFDPISVTLSSSSPTGEFASSPSIFDTWTPTYVVTVGDGATFSSPAYYRDTSVGTPTLMADDGALVQGQLALPCTATVVADDFESGALTSWPYSVTSPGVVLSVSAAAAHRGTAGFRVTDSNATPGGTAEAGGAVLIFSPMQGDFHLRFWARVAPNSGVGLAAIATLVEGFNLMFESATTQLSAEGRSNAGWEVDPPFGTLSPEWHLIEMSVTGMGTATAAWEIFVDGTSTHTRSNLDTLGLSVSSVRVGEPSADAMEFTGTIDIDDVRLGRLPLASRLAVDSASASVGDCVPLTVSLTSTAGASTAAPYAMTLDMGSPAGALFQDAACEVPSAGPSLAAGALSATAWLRPSTSGAFPVTASHPDFLSSPGSLTVLPTPVTNPPGEGPGPLVTAAALRVGWSCSSVPDSASLWGLGGLVVHACAALRRRRAKTAS